MCKEVMSNGRLQVFVCNGPRLYPLASPVPKRKFRASPVGASARARTPENGRLLVVRRCELVSRSVMPRGVIEEETGKTANGRQKSIVRADTSPAEVGKVVARVLGRCRRIYLFLAVN